MRTRGGSNGGAARASPPGRAGIRRTRGTGRPRPVCVAPGVSARAAVGRADAGADRPCAFGRFGARNGARARPPRLSAFEAGTESAIRLPRADAPSTGGALAPWRLRRAAELIEARLAGDLGLAEIAAAAGLDAAGFGRAFQRATGVPLRQYLVRRRVERARALIEDGHRDLAAVALRAGFAGRAHLAAALRRHPGAPFGPCGRARNRG